MKTRTILLIALAIFVILSVIGGIKMLKLRKVEREKAVLETEYKALQNEKVLADASLQQKQKENKALVEIKIELEWKLQQYEKEKQLIIIGYEKKIADLVRIPIDTVYQYVYSYYVPLTTELPSYPFTESQVRKIHLGIFENQYLNDRLKVAEDGIAACSSLNIANDKIIENLSGQNMVLMGKNAISDKQINNLGEQLDLCNKQARKQKRKTFFYKATTVVAGTLAVVFAIK